MNNFVNSKRPFILCVLFCVMNVGQSQNSPWKEYSFPNDGFAITLPSPPNVHPDSQAPDITVYTVLLPKGIGVSLRVTHQDRDCLAAFEDIKTGTWQSAHNVDSATFQSVSVNNYPSVAFQYKPGAKTTLSDNYYCVNRRWYTISAAWPNSHSRPEDVNRIIKSFHLLNQPSHK
jgi:hypothetical protein